MVTVVGRRQKNEVVWMMWWLKLRKIWIVEDPEVGAPITNETRAVDGQTQKVDDDDEKNHTNKHEARTKRLLLLSSSLKTQFTE